MEVEKIRAIGLLSGGLDSILAVRTVMDQGVDVLALHFISPFFSADKRGREAEVAAYYRDTFGINVRIVDVSDEYMRLIANPRYGYGKNFNPCIDCKLFLFKCALKILQDEGAKFLITGEVIGQRPMSQRRDTMNLIARELGARDILLRPLSAKIMDPTLPEREGWVDREKLYGFSGRSRKPQIRLAKEIGISEYPTPAGGCRLTDPIQAARISRYFQETPVEKLSSEDVRLLQIGRPFVLPGGSILTIGRIEAENNAMEKLLGPGDVILRALEVTGPIGLLRSRGGPDEKSLAAGIVLAHTPKRTPDTTMVFGGPTAILADTPIEAAEVSPEQFAEWRR